MSNQSQELSLQTSSRPWNMPKMGPFSARRMDRKPIFPAPELLEHIFIEACSANPSLSWLQFIWKCVPRILTANAWIFAPMNFCRSPHQSVNGGPIAMKFDAIDTDNNSACIDDADEKQRAIVNRQPVANNPSAKYLKGKLGFRPPQLQVTKGRSECSDNNTAHRPKLTPTHNQPSSPAQLRSCACRSGVVVNFSFNQGTGAGSTAQESPNITFSESAA
ncbi:hypothetical protein ACI2KT_01230 [Ensifer adhaerens]|uniref:hypothetical protein n=1 Tax=Ensifer adhaerens TaxID=106592 RepID=UPI00384BCD73